MKRGGKFVAQFYPKNDAQTESIMGAAKVAGFGGGLVIDDPESKRHKKYYLVLTAGMADRQINLTGAEMDAPQQTKSLSRKRKRAMESKKEFINRKKDIMRKRGRKVAEDSKFTGRKRRPRF